MGVCFVCTLGIAAWKEELILSEQLWEKGAELPEGARSRQQIRKGHLFSILKFVLMRKV